MIERLTKELTIPSVVQQIETDWSEKAKVDLFIKRDDLIHPLISGNKFRKLNGWFSAYEGKEILLLKTFGGPYSNHLVAIAESSRILGLPAVGVVRGSHHKTESPVIKLCKELGMKIEFTSYAEYNSAKGIGKYDKGVLTVPEGGSGKPGAEGCATIVEEIKESYEAIFVPCGTGATLAGMINSTDQNVVGIQVLKGDGYIKEVIAKEYSLHQANVLDSYHCGGYAKLNQELIEFIDLFYKQTSILLDPIYTGKMMLAIKKQVEKNDIKTGSRVLAIHTGGLTGWMGMEKYKPKA